MRLDPEKLASDFTADGVYHGMPAGSVGGRENTKNMIKGFIGPWTETESGRLNLMSADDVGIAERLDRTKAGNESVDLACTGVFELEDGKIEVRRESFDLGTYTKAMS